jgi:hypothetical protein
VSHSELSSDMYNLDAQSMRILLTIFISLIVRQNTVQHGIMVLNYPTTTILLSSNSKQHLAPAQCSMRHCNAERPPNMNYMQLYLLRAHIRMHWQNSKWPSSLSFVWLHWPQFVIPLHLYCSPKEPLLVLWRPRQVQSCAFHHPVTSHYSVLDAKP